MIHERIAGLIGWTIRDVRSMSMPALRDIVRPIDPKLADAISEEIQTGRVIRQRGVESVAPGDVVRLTGYFLRATGQVVGDEGCKHWIVQTCDCRMCLGGDYCAVRFFTLDRRFEAPWQEEERDGEPGWRHIALWNLERVGDPPRLSNQAEEVGIVSTATASSKRSYARHNKQREQQRHGKAV